MIILFFTPWLKASAIGRVSSLVVEELIRQGHEVSIVRAEDTPLFDQPTHRFSGKLILWNQADRIRAQARQSDLIIYQIGNNFAYHRGCVEWLPTLPGLVSLHDNFLGHLFWSCAEVMGRQRAKELLARLYDATVAHRFFDHANSTSFINYASEAAPMTEWIVAMASGVIVHSSWAMARITRACRGPVEVVPLSYDAPFLDQPGEDEAPRPPGGEQIVVLTIGHVNPNKRYESVIAAIGLSPQLREQMVFRIVGLVEPAMAEILRAQANRLGVRVVITGEVESHRLASEIRAADIMCCLRWPALEAASASTIEAMLYGKPAIVVDTGFYSDLPNDCVLKISPHDEIAGLRIALERLANAPAERVAMGKLAGSYAAVTFRADHYAERIVAIKSRIDQTKIVVDAARIFSGTLERWGRKGMPALLDPVSAPLSIFR